MPAVAVLKLCSLDGVHHRPLLVQGALQPIPFALFQLLPLTCLQESSYYFTPWDTGWRCKESQVSEPHASLPHHCAVLFCRSCVCLCARCW